MAFLNRTERVALLIDGSNLAYSMREVSQGKRLDYSKLYRWAQQGCYLVTARYYSAVHTDENGVQPMRDRLTWLQSNGYHVIEKPAITQGDEIKGNMDVEMACDMFKLSPRVDRFILFTGDGDFTCAVKLVQDMGNRVDVVSTERMSSLLLRRQADSFVDLRKLVDQLV